MVTFPRSLALVTGVALIALGGCSKPGNPITAQPSSAAPANAPARANADAAQNALTPDQKAEIAKVASTMHPARRSHLRYALATDDAGKPQFVLYDDLGLGSAGKTGHKGEYIVFAILNRTDGSHYDPQQNALVAAIPAPRDRDLTLIPR